MTIKSHIEEASKVVADQFARSLDSIICAIKEQVTERVLATQAGLTRNQLADLLGVTEYVVRGIVYDKQYKAAFEQMSALQTSTTGRTQRVYFAGAIPLLQSLIKREEALPNAALREKALRIYLDKGQNIIDIAKTLGTTPARVTRQLKSAGILTAMYLSKHFPTLDDLATKKIDGVRLYAKDAPRTAMIEAGAKAVTFTAPTGYLGLEGPNFASYIETCRRVPIDPKKSLIPEHNRTAYHLMLSIVHAHHSIEGGRIFKGLTIEKGNLEHVIQKPEYRRHAYGWLNLDFEGGWAPEKGRTIHALFEQRKLAQQAVLFLTLNNEERMKAKCAVDFGQPDQCVVATNFIAERAKENGYTCELIQEQSYKSRMTNTKPMLVLGYKITRN